MRRLFIGLSLTASVVACHWVASATPAEARGGKTAATIGGLIAGTAIAAAISPKQRVVERIYVTPPPAPPPQPTFSPGPGIICYAAQRACYDLAGAYNPRWTYQIYAR